MTKQHEFRRRHVVCAIKAEFELGSCLHGFVLSASTPSCVRSTIMKTAPASKAATMSDGWWKKDNPANMKDVTSIQQLVDECVRGNSIWGTYDAIEPACDLWGYVPVHMRGAMRQGYSQATCAVHTVHYSCNPCYSETAQPWHMLDMRHHKHRFACLCRLADAGDKLVIVE